MRRFLNLAVVMVFCSAAFITISCENDISEVGSGLLDTGASANAYFVDLVAYNTNNDSIRSDEAVLQNAAVGVYEEPVFGRTKAKFFTQARLGRLEPDFGESPEMDSVILNIPVFHKNKDAVVDTTYLYLAEGETPSDTATVVLKRTYKLDSIYGNTAMPITLQVREVAQFLNSQDTVYYSNPNLAACAGCPNINDIQVFPEVLGAQLVSNEIVTYQTKKRESIEDAPPVVVGIKLDKDYFKQKFIDNQNSADLRDQASFIRNFFRGIELSAAENQGFIMNFNTQSPEFKLTMHYSYDNPVEDDGEENYKPRLSGNLPLTFASVWSSVPGYNVQLMQFEHANRSSQFVNSYTNPNIQEGDSRLYLAGMDGTKTVVELKEEQINEIRNNVQNNGWAVIGAELTFHIDDSYGLKKPPYLFAWHNHMDGEKEKNENFTDVFKFFNSYPLQVQFNPMYDYKSDPKTYTIRVTDYVKQMVEQNEEYDNSKIMVSLGNFMLNPGTNYSSVLSTKNPFLNDRVFNPHRLVLHGSNSEQVDKRVRLKVYYTKS